MSAPKNTAKTARPAIKPNLASVTTAVAAPPSASRINAPPLVAPSTALVVQAPPVLQPDMQGWDYIVAASQKAVTHMLRDMPPINLNQAVLGWNFQIALQSPVIQINATGQQVDVMIPMTGKITYPNHTVIDFAINPNSLVVTLDLSQASLFLQCMNQAGDASGYPYNLWAHADPSSLIVAARTSTPLPSPLDAKTLLGVFQALAQYEAQGQQDFKITSFTLPTGLPVDATSMPEHVDITFIYNAQNPDRSHAALLMTTSDLFTTQPHAPVTMNFTRPLLADGADATGIISNYMLMQSLVWPQVLKILHDNATNPNIVFLNLKQQLVPVQVNSGNWFDPFTFHNLWTLSIQQPFDIHISDDLNPNLQAMAIWFDDVTGLLNVSMSIEEDDATLNEWLACKLSCGASGEIELTVVQNSTDIDAPWWLYLLLGPILTPLLDWLADYIVNRVISGQEKNLIQFPTVRNFNLMNIGTPGNLVLSLTLDWLQDDLEHAAYYHWLARNSPPNDALTDWLAVENDFHAQTELAAYYRWWNRVRNNPQIAGDALTDWFAAEDGLDGKA